MQKDKISPLLVLVFIVVIEGFSLHALTVTAALCYALSQVDLKFVFTVHATNFGVSAFFSSPLFSLLV